MAGPGKITINVTVINYEKECAEKLLDDYGKTKAETEIQDSIKEIESLLSIDPNIQKFLIGNLNLVSNELMKL